MKLQTQIPLSPVTNHQINYSSKIVLFGSCFSEHISEKFKINRFNAFSNPFGILFHVKAIENLIDKTLSGFKYSDKDVFELNEQFQCFDAHSKLNQLSRNQLISVLNTNLTKTKHQLIKASHVIITLGTSWTYKHKSLNKIVANCHKIPQQEFEKTLLSIEDISRSLQHIIKIIRQVNPKAQFIFTVSPVRHIKDGFVENTLSKAHLISATHHAISKIANATYFPSYEIVLDQLRDYRFYNDDLLHPNQTAISYIWKQFLSVWTNKETHSVLKAVKIVRKGLAHKSFNPESKAHKQFLEDLKLKKDALEHLHNIQF